MREEVSATRGPRARIELTIEALQVALHPCPMAAGCGIAEIERRVLP